MIQRTPNDAAWYRGGLFHDDMVINVPGLWMMSWYDVSVGPNLATFNHVRKTARPEIANQQYAVIAPTLHCAMRRATENTVVGERSMGDARLIDRACVSWLILPQGEKRDCSIPPQVGTSRGESLAELDSCPRAAPRA